MYLPYEHYGFLRISINLDSLKCNKSESDICLRLAGAVFQEARAGQLDFTDSNHRRNTKKKTPLVIVIPKDWHTRRTLPLRQ